MKLAEHADCITRGQLCAKRADRTSPVSRAGKEDEDARKGSVLGKNADKLARPWCGSAAVRASPGFIAWPLGPTTTYRYRRNDGKHFKQTARLIVVDTAPIGTATLSLNIQVHDTVSSKGSRGKHTILYTLNGGKIRIYKISANQWPQDGRLAEPHMSEQTTIPTKTRIQPKGMSLDRNHACEYLQLLRKTHRIHLRHSVKRPESENRASVCFGDEKNRVDGYRMVLFARGERMQRRAQFKMFSEPLGSLARSWAICLRGSEKMR